VRKLVVEVIYKKFPCFVTTGVTGIDPDADPRAPLPLDFPQVTYQYVKHLALAHGEAVALPHLEALTTYLSGSICRHW
jgi:hypothetical protein